MTRGVSGGRQSEGYTVTDGRRRTKPLKSRRSSSNVSDSYTVHPELRFRYGSFLEVRYPHFQPLTHRVGGTGNHPVKTPDTVIEAVME